MRTIEPVLFGSHRIDVKYREERSSAVQSVVCDSSSLFVERTFSLSSVQYGTVRYGTVRYGTMWATKRVREYVLYDSQ